MSQGYSINQVLGQKQTTILAPQLQQGVRILQLSSIELQNEIESALEANPFLEKTELEPGGEFFADSVALSAKQPARDVKEDRSFTRYGAISPLKLPPQQAANSGLTPGHRPDQYAGDQLATEIDATRDQDLHGFLSQQAAITPLSERDHYLLELLIDSVNDRGYLRAKSDEIIQLAMPDFVVTRNDVAAAIKILQGFEPVGVGARNASECLLLQLRELSPDTPGIALAETIVERYLLLLAKKDLAGLARALEVDDARLQIAIGLIRQLNPFPGLAVCAPTEEYIVPDLIVKRIQNRWLVRLNPNITPTIAIHQESAELLKLARGQEGYEGLRKRLQDARTLLSNLEKRYHTLLRVAAQIVLRQQAFLEQGRAEMQPLTQREIADSLEINVSTVSRAVRDKYILTPAGVLELGAFFSSSISREGGKRISSKAIQEQVRVLIEQESSANPLSDLKIAEILATRGISIARRTVMKYRTILGIPASPKRRA